ncbi:MAG: GrpB family protein [Candidatus Latescibacteria bacterium]|nr:GrpB family protein [Candidatus Latescibacterota bacterium]
MNSPVIIVPYNLHWPDMYREEKSLILGLLGAKITAIEHIGSTAVPGLGAKPIIDMMIGVRELVDAIECIKLLRDAGYTYIPEFEVAIPERRFMWKGSAECHTIHLHMVEATSDFWQRHILFRDYLRAHPGAAAEYHTVKTGLAAQYRNDRDGYTDAKSLFIKSVEEKARKERNLTHNKEYCY